MSGSVLWLRRDLRRGDHPALAAAAEGGTTVHPLFVIDPVLWDRAGPSRRAWVAASVQAAAESYEGRLSVRFGEPAPTVVRFARAVEAASVHVSGETTPAAAPTDLRLGEPQSDARVDGMLDKAVRDSPVPLPEAGERAALRRWRDFLERVGDYHDERDRPDHDGTSRLSPYLKVGAIHSRTLLADLAHKRSEGAATFTSEIAWREFYADVLHYRPRTAWHDLREELRDLRYDDQADAVAAWQQGETGFPIVDAGMRQLRATGWMHNRVRMITASFLTKDLHAWWPVGARYFLDHLLDGDLASNSHGWQWVAGTGTDAAPYFRVFNPITQGRKFDPAGDYIRQWVPELRHLAGAEVHEPWRHDDGYRHGYPRRLIDHAAERTEALERYRAARG